MDKVLLRTSRHCIDPVRVATNKHLRLLLLAHSVTRVCYSIFAGPITLSFTDTLRFSTAFHPGFP